MGTSATIVPVRQVSCAAAGDWLGITLSIHPGAAGAGATGSWPRGPGRLTRIQSDIVQRGRLPLLTSSDPGQPSYDPLGLPLVPGLIELVTAASSAPGERHADVSLCSAAIAAVGSRQRGGRGK